MNERIRHLEAAEAYLTGAGDPNGIVNAAEGTAYWDNVGDLLYYNTDGVTAWQVIGGGAPGAPHNLLSATHTDSTPQAVSRGSLVYGDATPTWNELVHPGTMYHLQTDATDVVWAQNITMADDAWIGSDSTSPKIQFDSDGDQLELTVTNGMWEFTGNATSPILRGGYSGNVNAQIGSVITGGGAAAEVNTISATYSFIGSGKTNTIGATSQYGVIAGGIENSLVAAESSVISGGYDNYIQGPYSTIPGGYSCYVTGTTAFAAGRQARAIHTGSFVWADSEGANFDSEGEDSFNIRSSAGMFHQLDTALTNTIQTAKTTRHYTSGAAAAGYGVAEAWALEDDGGTLRTAGRASVLWTSAAAGTYTSARTWSLVNNAGALTEYMRLTPTGLGVGVTAPTARAHIDQSSAVGAIPVLTLDQGDVSEQHIVLSMSGADVDFPNILQLAVTGSPALWWDESENSFGLKNVSGLLVQDADIIGNSTTTACLGFNSSGATDYAYFSGCYVGIGTTTPADWLHISDTSADSTPGIRINNDANAWRFQVNATYADGITIRDQTNATIPFTIESSAPTNAIYVKATGRVGIAVNAPAGQMTIDQGSTTAAIPVLELDQADLSEEFINFISTVGAGNPIDTAALGTYYGKVRVQVQGVGYKMMALYNS